MAKTVESGMTMTKKRSFSMNGEAFEVDVKYKPVKVVGEGSGVLVCSCLDVETGRHVAVKKISDPFRSRKGIQSMSAVREAQILRQARHPNVVSVKDVMLSSDSNDVYLVQELMDMDLFHLLLLGRMSGDLCRSILHQILLGVSFLHSANVIHRDLKPENIFIKKANSAVKIGDFGHARTMKTGSYKTDFVGSTWYKAPELLYGWGRYTKAVDMWSVGCIFGVMLSGKLLFCGETTLEQIKEIVKVLGTPKDLSYVEGEMAREYLKGLAHSRGTPLGELCPEAELEAIDLLEKMLEFHPRKRITAEEALRHPFFAGLKASKAGAPPATATETTLVVKLEVDEDDPDLVDAEKMREMIRQEVLLYHPPASPDLKK